MGVGAIIADSFSILLGKFTAVMLMALVPTVIGLVISGVLIGWNVALGLNEPQFFDARDGIAFVLSILVNMVVYAIATGLLVQLAYDAKLRRPLKMDQYVSRALGAAVPITVLGLAAGILTAIAAVALIIPGLWVYAVFSVIAPAVVIEQAGFRGLNRSAELTKEYRWPILGALIVIGICGALVNLVGDFIMSTIGGGILINAILYAVLSAVVYGLGGIAVALIYARLRQIKEGISVDQIASVFD